MKERPILFSGPMVSAILDERKTQTRRIVNRLSGFGPVCEFGISDTRGYDWHFRNQRMLWNDVTDERLMASCPYGRPGDRLFVRETGWQRPERSARDMREGADTWPPYVYDADGLTETDAEQYKQWGWKRRPSIHMPRKASRITLEVTGVRVERLQEIGEEDAIAEGLERIGPAGDGLGWRCAGKSPDHPGSETARLAYRYLWDSLNAKRAPWASNPWVWVVEFRKMP